ncbi:MAG: lysophospholipid acyltransferase family protein [Candidatus Marinimicrobia bacterium]|nr:lysophospholipid acyltransferase family protein [Candidatus Neomarinimicrobiota bacterium]MBL7108718.1 lysophospholipid acyltransferase family protein [Candidatus Neomarinimicrobiota bacterium]
MKIKAIIYSFLGRLFLSSIFRLNKIIVEGEEHLTKAIKTGNPLMLCSWHGRLSYAAFYLFRANIRPWAIASKHFDAEIVARIVHKWGFRLIRGSSTRGGKEVVRKMGQIFKTENNIIALTNDGPRGPAGVAKPGSVAIAKKHNALILSISGTSTKYWEFKSWDKFRLPKPFGTIKISIAPPLNYQNQTTTQEEDSKIVSDYLNNHQTQSDKW